MPTVEPQYLIKNTDSSTPHATIELRNSDNLSCDCATNFKTHAQMSLVSPLLFLQFTS
jgi:hypothetical protein